MKLDKTIHIRVSDTVYDLIAKNADSQNKSVSAYSRDVLEESIGYITGYKNPFNHNEFNHFIQWIFNLTFCSPPVMIYDVEHYLAILEKYYPFLDKNIRKLLDNVRFELEDYIEQYEKVKHDLELCYLKDYIFSFHIQGNTNSFDYRKFYEYILELDTNNDKYIGTTHLTITL
jgi:hypothetical protein